MSLLIIMYLLHEWQIPNLNSKYVVVANNVIVSAQRKRIQILRKSIECFSHDS
jgi:hypothetical protein